MKLIQRAYSEPDDYNRIRSFLQNTLIHNDLIQYNWPVARWDYWRWHGVANLTHARLEDVVFLWETHAGDIAAVLNPESEGEAFLQVHPDYRTPELEAEILTTAETRMAACKSDGTRLLHTWAVDGDVLRESLLIARGYSRLNVCDHMRRRALDGALPDAKTAPGYSIRAQGDDEIPARSWASWRAFHPDEPDENYQGWEWYCNIQRAPGYRRDLDLVAVAPTGEIAGFCTVWSDPVTRTGMFEPVGVVPEHQRLGIGKSLVVEGLQRLKALGARVAYVGSYGEPAHSLYVGAGFIDLVRSFAWEKCY